MQACLFLLEKERAAFEKERQEAQAAAERKREKKEERRGSALRKSAVRKLSAS